MELRQFPKVVVLCLLLLSAAPTAAVGAPITAKALLAAAVTNAKSQKCVHENSVNTASKSSGTMSNDICTSAGQQTISLSDGSLMTTVALLDQGVAYVKGNVTGLHNYFGFPTAQSKNYANRWMKAGPSSTYWQVMTASTTLKSDFGTTLALSHPIFLDKVTSLRGVKATKISGKVRSGTTSFKVTVWISQGAVPLPIQAHITAPNARITVTWSNWGESVNFPLPAATVPFPF